MMKQLIFVLFCTATLSFALCPFSNVSAQPKHFAGYLFAYFEGGGDKNLQEQLRFAASEDAMNWYALNGNKPIIASDSISESGGIRDPHILRGEDGCFYIVATDMMVAKNGWNENPGIVLMKSRDLVNWTHSKINLGRDWPAFSDAYWVWAPQTIYDREAKKYMIYFTLQRTGDNRQSLITYYAYANRDFTAFESEPRPLFAAKYGSIDNDIIYKDGTYHLFYKGNTKDLEGKEVKNGIQQATSKRLTGPWKEDFKYLDAYAGTTTHVEGSSVFPLHDESGQWMLMYDLYGSGRYEYQTSTDLIHFTCEPLSFRKDFFPRHGSVISVTEEELNRLQQKWGWVLTHEFESTGNPIIRDKHTADPAVLVEGDTLWLFAGHDAEGGQSKYIMRDWLLYSTTDMRHWTEYPSPLHINDFAWAKSRQAYAGHVAKGKDGRYYWYVSTNWCGIGVAVADKITGPYKDALGRPLLTNEDCFDSRHSWACIDPAILIDDDGTPYIVWGNRECYIARLKDNMIEIDGDIHRISIDERHPFTEAPWLHKRGGKYYLTYASEWPEKIAYAVADNPFGPYTPQGIISEIAGNSNTTHPAIVQFKNQWLFFSHNGGLSDGTSYSRSIIAEPLSYDSEGRIKPIPSTAEGVKQLADAGLLSAFLMVYHKDADHSLHMALSRDGYSWKALNNDAPVVSGDTIALQHGIRDPHIYRGPDGTYYIAATDLHLFGQRMGYRDTEWERDGKEYGWGNNRALVLMKSRDLIHWTHVSFRIDEAFPQRFGQLGCAWAPETIYDSEEGKLMVYFTVRPTGKGKTKLYYAYANDEFTALVTEPQLLFEYPDENIQVLDADIIPMPDGRYCMTYCAQEGPAGIKMAISNHLNRGYVYQPQQIDSEKGSCEAPTMYKLIDEDRWLLMYDIFSIKPHNFGFMETTDFKTFTPLGPFGEGRMQMNGCVSPKHGAVTLISEEEARRLEAIW